MRRFARQLLVLCGWNRTATRLVLAALGGLLILGLVGALVTRSPTALLLATVGGTGILAVVAWALQRTRRELRTLQSETRDLAAVVRERAAGDARRIAALEDSLALLTVQLAQRGAAGGPPLGNRPPTAATVLAAARALVDRGDPIDAHILLASVTPMAGDRRTLRVLRRELKRRGYLTRALDVARRCAEVTQEKSDLRECRAIEGEIAVLTGQLARPVLPQRNGYRPRPGRVLHLVSSSRLDKQLGYTLRTQYIVRVQQVLGLDPQVVTQMGVGGVPAGVSAVEFDGVVHHRISGPARGQVPFDEWMLTHVERVAGLVADVRPAVLHAASDFVNAWTAQLIGRHFGIPVVYESRGFWEETWLSRQTSRYDWDVRRLRDRYGLPEAYLWRRELEDRCRREADHVVTLAEVMADRIEAGGVPRNRITVVPNGVDTERFPVLERNRELAAKLGLGDGTVVVGYISTLNEYEGIDTLVSAYGLARAASPVPVRLLVVGDGPERERLVRHAASLGLEDVTFIGQVPHPAVVDYYSLIDIFVVPRRPAEVCQLVTPLKPFEAFATGRTVVLSNVRSLAAIAEQSQAAELFEAGDEVSLATVLASLLKDPDRRRALAAAGAAWVRAERSWVSVCRSYLPVYQRLTAATWRP